MTIPAVGAVGSVAGGGFTPYVPQTLPVDANTPASSLTGAGSVGDLAGTGVTAATGAAGATGGADFASMLSHGMQSLQGLHSTADSLALKASTGDLGAIHDYTIAATEASVATQLTTAVRNKALEAFNEIMRMSV
jgi:flagellar hook-basal body complex protein FliE